MSDLDFSTDESKASYGVGLQMGQQLASVFEGVSLEAALAGIEDGFAAKAPRVEGQAINDAFGVIQERLQAAEAEKAKEFSAEGEAFLAENAKRDEVTVTESGLQYEVIEQGDGATPTADSAVKAHYRGTLINGEQFDSSYDRGEPTEFPVGGVIAGWTEALQLMNVGSKWKLYIPYHLAYGERGAGGAIGPFATLIFDIELVEVL